MTKITRLWTAAAVGAAAAFAFSSCAYDPYYSAAGLTVPGYGDGYGYGGSGFSTSLFVSTGDPRWGYDPYSYSYYDYRSHRYYDPYLYGYYPVGYRPPAGDWRSPPARLAPRPRVLPAAKPRPQRDRLQLPRPRLGLPELQLFLGEPRSGPL